MGDLPTPDELEKGKFAKAEDYLRAKKIVTEGLGKLYAEGKLYGASFYGSTTNGEIRLGSDIDVMVVPYSIVDCTASLQKIRSDVEALHVPIEINPLVSVRQAEKGMHRMLLFFTAYMRKAITDETIIGNNPMNVAKPSDVEIPSSLEFVLDREEELRRLTRDVTTPLFSKAHCKFLSRMVNYTLFIPKDIYFAKHDRLPNDKIPSKAGMVEIYKKEFPEMKSDALEDTLMFWKETKKIIEQGHANANEYKGLLCWFASQYDRIEDFMIQNIDLAKKMFNERYGGFKKI
jgi:predicted nucleotidyltransferase